MKIAVFHNLPSGGAKRALYGFVRYLSGAGHEVDAFVPQTAEEEFLPLKPFVKHLRVFPVRRTAVGSLKSTIKYVVPVGMYDVSLADLERTQKEIAIAVNDSDYDVVLSEQDRYTMSPFFLKFVKRPTLYYCQQPFRALEAILKNIARKNGYVGRVGPFKRVWRKYLSVRLRRVDEQNASFARYILTNSYFSRESILRSYGLNAFVCYLGVDTAVFRPVEASRENYVLSVGSCTVTKGYDFIVSSLAHVDPRWRPKFLIVSNVVDTRWKSYLERLADERGVEMEVRLLVGEKELVELYGKAKLFLYGPYLEPFGLAPLEAMACGTPVIAVKEGGVRETVVHGETGFLTERDEHIFAEAITALLLDEAKRRSMSQKAVEVIHDFWTLRHAGERLLWHFNRARRMAGDGRQDGPTVQD